MNEHISKIINSPHRDKVLIGLGSFLLGAGSGVIIGFRRGRMQTEEEIDRIDASIRQATSEYRDTDLPEEIVKEGPVPLLIVDADEYKARTAGEDFVRQITGDDDIVDIPVLVGDDEPDVISQNVFAGNDIEWDHDEEVKTRSEDKPYILHKDEFYENEKDYTQVTLTYYAGDNIVASEDDQIVNNYENVTGPLRFGHGSGDTKVFYVRNDKAKAEYEIVRHDGRFEVEVLGFEIESTARAGDLKHERLSKFRPD